MAVTGHHARLGTQLLAKLYHGHHLRRLNLVRLQGATLTEPYVKLSLHTALLIRGLVGTGNSNVQTSQVLWHGIS
jgi:hypothetical protein